MSINSLEWARDLRSELKTEIQTLAGRGGADDEDAEELGLVPQSDHLDDLKGRLAQVERLIDAIEDSGASQDAGWFPAMGADNPPAQPAKTAG